MKISNQTSTFAVIALSAALAGGAFAQGLSQPGDATHPPHGSKADKSAKPVPKGKAEFASPQDAEHPPHGSKADKSAKPAPKGKAEFASPQDAKHPPHGGADPKK